MKDLILRTRLDSMKENMNRVFNVLDSIRPRREELQNLSFYLGELEITTNEGKIEQGITKKLEDLQRKLGLIKFQLTSDEAKTSSDLDAASKEIAQILAQLKSAREIIGKMQGRSVPISKEISDTLTAELLSVVKECNWTVGEISKKLDQAQDAEEKNDEDTARKALADAWEEYGGELYKDSQLVYTEYVDFLRGLALRDAGYDEEICAIADELIRTCETVTGMGGWRSLTIPARQLVTRTLARIIRLGFPEWTIWALPLAAYEFGHIVIDQNKRLSNYISSNSQAYSSINHLRDYVADAFATFTMGPAYASASILLFFDPLHAYTDQPDHPADAQRAFVILAMLKYIDEIEDQHPYHTIITDLESAWQAALQQANPEGALSTEEAQKLELLVKEVWKPFYFHVGEPYSGQSWRTTVKEWKEKLKAGNGDKIEPTGLEDLRDVLNAAWQCRIYHPDKSNEIAEASRHLWERLVKKRRDIEQKSRVPGGYVR